MPKGENVKKLWNNPKYRKHMSEVHKGKSNGALLKWRKNGGHSWNKGISIKSNNALEIWRKNGGQPWLKGKKGFRTGEKNNMWKGGITPLFLQIRHSFECRQWRSDVLTRDDFICHKCGQRGYELRAHHIKGFNKIIDEYQIKTLNDALSCEELWNINNGITLCKNCHTEFHHIFGNRNNNKEQLNEFLNS